VTARDDVNGDISDKVLCTPASGSIFPLDVWTTVTCTVEDAAGNEAEPKSFKVKAVDTTAPVVPDLDDITVNATSAAGGVANYGPAFANDTVDGPNVPVIFDRPSGSTFPIITGTTTVYYWAADAHGNTSESKSLEVKVLVPCANGLNQPINNDGSSSFKLGSTVPVKFNCFPGLTATLSVVKKDATADGSSLEAINSNPADTGNLFRYDATAGQYIFNLGTKNLTQGDWYLHVFLGDGVDHITKISLRK
jgi:hypothetical protein